MFKNTKGNRISTQPDNNLTPERKKLRETLTCLRHFVWQKISWMEYSRYYSCSKMVKKKQTSSIDENRNIKYIPIILYRYICVKYIISLSKKHYGLKRRLYVSSGSFKILFSLLMKRKYSCSIYTIISSLTIMSCKD